MTFGAIVLAYTYKIIFLPMEERLWLKLKLFQAL